MRKFASIIATTGLALVLAACGDSGNGDLSGGGSTTGSGGTGTGTGSTTTYEMGNGTGGGFQSGVIGLTSTSLSAGGSTSLAISIVDRTGTLYASATGVPVTINSPCIASGLAMISTTAGGAAVTSVTTTTGIVQAVYTANGCSGSDVISATAAVGSQTLTATGTVNIATAAVGSIQFVSATPPSITLKGVGSAGGSATSTVIFKVLNTGGGPSVGNTVNFSLNTTVGGISMTPMSATSDNTGEVRTVVSSGTVAASVRVTAATVANGSTISTESNALTVSTGIPTSNNVSLAVKCQNVEAWDYDGVSVPVTVSMTDRFSNPVPDGTTANFQTALGGIQASCQTGSAASGSGACAVNWVSKAPYSVSGNPQSTSGNANVSAAYCSNPVATALNLCNSTTNGRSAILVTAIGEESFKDAVGNGFFNAGDTVAWDATNADNNFTTGSNAGQPKPWQDTSEPFLNQWELYDQYGTPTFVLGEPYMDFNSNGTRDGPDGMVESALCQGPLCNTNESSVAIGASNLIILSGSNPNYTILTSTTPVTNTINHAVVSVGGGTTFMIEIFDDRGQQMPNGTTVAFSMSTGSTISITSPQPTGGWPCSTAAPYVDSNGNFIAGQHYSVSLALANPAPANGQVYGTLFVTVTTPRGLTTSMPVLLSP
jgi:hypothetical protein